MTVNDSAKVFFPRLDINIQVDRSLGINWLLMGQEFVLQHIYFFTVQLREICFLDVAIIYSHEQIRFSKFLGFSVGLLK